MEYGRIFVAPFNLRRQRDAHCQALAVAAVLVDHVWTVEELLTPDGTSGIKLYS
jgi:hypothetical protein